MSEPIQLVESIFNKWSPTRPLSIVPLPESGSYRTYFRIQTAHGNILGVHNTDIRENQAFIYLNHQLLKTGNRVPEVLFADLDNHVYFEQDLGNVTLFEHLAELRNQSFSDEDLVSIYKKVIDAMPALQIGSTLNLDYSHCYPRAEFDIQSMMWDMNYFKYCLLKPLKISFFEQDLEDDFLKIVGWLIEADRSSFMFRDFQSRNIMLSEDELYFIDFQGGRKGPLQYDLASLLFEAKTHLPHGVRQQLLDYYLEVFSKNYSWFIPEKFLQYYYGFVYLRLMQAMGAYGFRGYIERKPLFLQSLPYAVKTLAWLLEHKPMPLNLVSLPGVFEKLISMPQIREHVVQQDMLTVTINSFSYKNGIPQDHSGNGGGFIFDCRYIENPGRYDEYKELTGLDQPVKDFLHNKPDVKNFFSHACSLIDHAVEVYTQRGFTHLMVSFGCTGGQHRSVYMTELLADWLKNRNGIHTVVIHHELDKKSRGK